MSLGNVLRHARESARLSIDDLASMTSIRSGLIAQMENDDFHACGGDTYARGHLRTIAQKLNIDPHELLDIYDAEHSAVQKSIQDLLVENNVTTPSREKSGISFKTLSLISIAIIAIAAIAQIIVSNSSSTGESVKVVVQESVSPQPSELASESPSPSKSASPTSSNSITTLKIMAVRGNASIDIVTKDGHLYKGWLLMGQSKEFSSDSRISIYVSNAGGVDVFINGSKIPALGVDNEEVRRTFP